VCSFIARLEESHLGSDRCDDPSGVIPQDAVFRALVGVFPTTSLNVYRIDRDRSDIDQQVPRTWMRPGKFNLNQLVYAAL
jgi:hypothetical protein